ncbi:AfsR/SARP family transcriptional regulator [Catenulispora pinisilvae]|uniref:AfsR/SARP family transcriptional regulator n=1 Tax=Catenulispora pinisilvae TaxID=2705253 RepID=UPI0018922767|nr:BTAD domain-containing putative transcriptional regulator [Catenulispora pinisilvae]
MSSTVWFGLLGPVDIRLDGVPVPLPSARTRALLAALLCQPNRVVSVDGLVDAVWGADPPDGALTTLRSHVMRLRRCLGPEAGRLQTAAPGYRLLLDPATELDTRMFVARHQAGQLAAAAGDWRSAARYAAEALALWRGEPLADVPSEQLQLDEAAAWAELRVEAIELRARADISLGRPADAAAAMRRLAADHPHREPAYALLMAALAAADRRAEALQVYRLLRTVLVRDLGMEPSPELRALQQRILAMDDSADDADDVDDAGGNGDGNGDGTTGDSTPRDEAGIAYVAWPPPHTLPRDVADFTGRGEQLRHITDAAAGLADPHTAFAAVIDGMAGIGKSALAVHAAHQLSDRFPDGQLYADLLGTSPEPAEPRAVLASFLRLLGISPAELPEPDMERAGLYRSLLAGRRVLVVLDDVRDSRQLAPLIPATPGCALLATTRDRHVGIAGAMRLSLGTLTLPESHALLTGIVGPDRTVEEPEATDELLAACAGSPLAIRAAGGRISARPTWQIADLATRVGVPGRRLDELRFADHDVRAGFEAGFAALAGLSDSAFGAGSGSNSSSENTLAISLCQLGLWSGGELGLSVAATLLGRPAPETEEILERLVDLNLLQAPRHGRYLLHDLVREFAAEKAQNLLTEEQRRAAAELWRLPRARSVKTPSSRKTPSSS